MTIDTPEKTAEEMRKRAIEIIDGRIKQNLAAINKSIALTTDSVKLLENDVKKIKGYDEIIASLIKKHKFYKWMIIINCSLTIIIVLLLVYIVLDSGLYSSLLLPLNK